jgi:hypothetical protein
MSEEQRCGNMTVVCQPLLQKYDNNTMVAEMLDIGVSTI